MRVTYAKRLDIPEVVLSSSELDQVGVGISAIESTFNVTVRVMWLSGAALEQLES